MVYSEERQSISGEGGRIQSETQDTTKDDLNHQEKLTFSKGCGVPDQMKIAEEKLQQKIRACREILSPRVEGSTPKVIQRDGLLRGRVTVRRFPSVSVP